MCTGYLAAWFINLHGFRQRSLVERVFWSVPLSVGISTIASVLSGKFLSLTAVVVFFVACAAAWLVVISREVFQLRRSGRKGNIGWRPFGGTAMMCAIIWAVAAVLMLVDFQSGHKLFMSNVIFDYAPRVSYVESVLHTGVPPANPLYWFRHASSMRYYYFWYVLCAAVARMSHLPARAVFIASCAWAGFVLAAITGLYLKHFLSAGVRLRKQFLVAIFLLSATGLDICVNFIDVLYFHHPMPGYLNVWTKGQITSWLVSILWDPHHVVSMACCMFAFLLAWLAGKDGARGRAVSVLIIAAALASAFGLSIYVTFAFFLLMLAWAVWQFAFERKPRPAFILAAGGACAIVLLIPYLLELMHTQSNIQGGSVFVFEVREMIPPDALLASHLFSGLAVSHPAAALNLVKLILLAPGYVVELGFSFAVFLIYLVPAWRKGVTLTPEHRALLVIAVASIPLLSFVRSGVLEGNDFGWRAALLLQYPLLLLASELLTGWRAAAVKPVPPAESGALHRGTPPWLRSIASFALILGVMGTFYQVLIMRFTLPVLEAAQHRDPSDIASNGLSHDAYIAYLGYAHLADSIPNTAIVQYNPAALSIFWTSVDWVGIDHQVAIAGDGAGCGSELGGDPTGCKPMAADIDALFRVGSAERARAVCGRYGIQYLVVRIYDPVWNDKSSWAWTLNPVVADEDFRALDCRR